MATHKMLIVSNAVKHQEAGLRAVGLKAHCFVESDRCLVLGIYAKSYNLNAQILGRIPQSLVDERAPYALEAMLRCCVHAPNERFV